MNNLDSLLKDIKKEIYSEPVVQEFLKVKKIIEGDEFKLLNKQIKELQKTMCDNMDNDDIYLPAKAKYDELNTELENNPVYQNYKALEEEVYAFLMQIKEELQ